MHVHIYIPSIKKDISYCKICQKLSYKEYASQSLEADFNLIINMDPMEMKYMPYGGARNALSPYQQR